MLDYLSARGKAALAAADEDALKTGGHGGGPDCWQNFSLAASSGATKIRFCDAVHVSMQVHACNRMHAVNLHAAPTKLPAPLPPNPTPPPGLALQPCNQTAPFSFARPRSPLPMCIGPLPRAPPNYPRPPSVGSFLGSAGPPHGNAFPAPDLQGLQGFLPPFATAPHLANQQQPYGGAREGPYAQGAFGPQGGAGPVSNAAAMAAMAAWGWAAASGGGGSGFPAFPPPPSAGSMLPGHAMFDYDRAGQQLQSGGMGAFGAFDAGGGGGSQQLARGVEDGTGAAGLSRGPPPPPAISRNLWLGNVMVADAEVLTQTFRAFGPIESVRVFVGRTYAFVNFAHEAHAAEAKAALEMQVIFALVSRVPAAAFTPVRLCSFPNLPASSATSLLCRCIAYSNKPITAAGDPRADQRGAAAGALPAAARGLLAPQRPGRLLMSERSRAEAGRRDFR
jgi:hypothetical protein